MRISITNSYYLLCEFLLRILTCCANYETLAINVENAFLGEFHLRLRQLEKSLLQALNEAKGKILDDDSVITTLETLKQEAADISKKVEETDRVIGEIETVSLQYKPLSQVGDLEYRQKSC